MGSTVMLTGKADTLESYRNETVNLLLRLRREYPWCWHKMAIQVNESSGAKALSGGSVVHWLEQRSDGIALN